MKRIFLSMITIALSIAATVSCNKDNTIITPKEDPTEDPSEEPSQDTPSVDGYTMLTDAKCTFYGDYYENGTSNFYFDFTKDAKYDEDDYMVSGTDVCVDLLLENGLTTFVDGEYPINDSEKAGTAVSSYPITYGEEVSFLAEYYDTDEASIIDYFFGDDYNADDIYNVEGTCKWYCGENDEAWSYTMVTGGTVKISTSGSIVTVLMNFKTDDGELKYAYKGSIEVTTPDEGDDDDDDDDDEGDDDDDDDDDDDEGAGDVTFNPYAVEAYNYGEDYGTLDYPYYDWVLYLMSESDGSDTYTVELDFFSDQSLGSSVLPTGEYSIKDDGEYYLYEPGCAIPYYYDEDQGWGYGCNYNDGNVSYEATDGSLSISKSGDEYTLEYKMYDYYGNAYFSGIYTGPISVFDESTEATTTETKALNNSKHLNNEKIFNNSICRSRRLGR